MKKWITIPLTLIKPYLTEGQLSVVTSKYKKTLEGKIESIESIDRPVDFPRSGALIFRKKLYFVGYTLPHFIPKKNPVIGVSCNIKIIIPPINFAGVHHNIEIKLSLKNSKVEKVSINSFITPSIGSIASGRNRKVNIHRNNYDGPFLKLLKKLLSLLKSFFKKNDL
jgi:hypothetical protein